MEATSAARAVQMQIVPNNGSPEFGMVYWFLKGEKTPPGGEPQASREGAYFP